MIRFTTTLALLVLGPLVVAGAASAQQKTLKEQLIGTWTLTANYAERQDGSRLEAFGKDPKGIFMLDAGGRFSYLIVAAERPKFASNNRREGTVEENKAAVEGIIAFYGRYSVDEANQVMTWHIERCVFPNWDGTDRKVKFELKGDELSYAAQPIPSASGPYVPHVAWRRER